MAIVIAARKQRAGRDTRPLFFDILLVFTGFFLVDVSAGAAARKGQVWSVGKDLIVRLQLSPPVLASA